MLTRLDAAPSLRVPLPPPPAFPPPRAAEGGRNVPPAGRRGAEARTPDRDRLLLAAGCGLAFGVLLGCWCRVFAHSSSVSGVLANLASPWVAAAFASGAVAAARPSGSEGRVARPVPEAIAGAIAGTICLVVATIVYYGPARTGGFDFSGAVFRTVFWTVAGVAAGVVFGAAGAVWRAASNPRLRAVCSVAFGAIVVGEAAFLVVAGATKYEAFAWPVLLAVAAVGLATPLLLGPADEAPKAVGWVVVLAVPVVFGGMVLVSVAMVIARALRSVL
jgi:hypothetical protein